MRPPLPLLCPLAPQIKVPQPKDTAVKTSDKSNQFREHCLHSSDDNTNLHVRQWWPAQAPVATVVIVHGYMEHGGRYRDLAVKLAAAGFACTAFDLRGHGRSAGPRGFVKDFGQYRADLRLVVQNCSVKGKPVFLFGHSLGGLIALDTLRAHPELAQGLLLSNPYLQNAIAIAPAKLWLNKWVGRLYPRLRAPSGIKRAWLSRDEGRMAEHANDPLVFTWASAGWFTQTLQAQTRVGAMQQLRMPLWFGIGGADPMASAAYNQRFAEQLQAPDKKVALYGPLLHELLQEREREAVMQDMLLWLQARSGSQPA